MFYNNNFSTIVMENYSFKKGTDLETMKTDLNYHEIFDKASIGIFIIDIDSQKIINANQKSCDITGYDKSELIGTRPFYFSLLGFSEQIKINKAGSINNFDWEWKRKDGSSRWIEVSCSVSNISGMERIISLFHEVDDRKSAELEREKITTELIQRTKKLEEFAHIVSHYLRSPVASILGMSNVLRENISAADQNKIQQYLFQSVEQLDEIVKDMNNILQIRYEVEENRQSVFFDKLVDNIKLSFQNLIQKECIQIHVDFSKVDKIDTIKSYVHNIFYNLISNSIKYRQPYKTLSIFIKSEMDNGKLKLSFKDNGLGIDLNQHKDKIFGPFKRFHMNVEGKGLGLFMVKTQVEMLGGIISVTSQPFEGTEFIIELPVVNTSTISLSSKVN